LAATAALAVLAGCGPDRVAAPSDRPAPPAGAAAIIENLTSAPILYDQRTSSNEALPTGGNPAGLVADEFVVPDRATWTVTHIALSGLLFTPTLTFAFREDAGGVPGSVIQSFTLVPAASDPNACGCMRGLATMTDYLFTLPTVVTLGPGTYWLASVSRVTPDSSFYWQSNSLVATGAEVRRSFDGGATWGTDPFSAHTSTGFVLFGLQFAGYFEPVDSPGPNGDVVNRAKAGQAIGVKFGLGGDRGLAIFRSGFPKFVSEPCDASDTQDDIEATTTSPTGLTYDPGNQRYTYVWKTDKAWAGKCGRLELGLTDGTDHYALFHFVR
jgi:hypothetical protein